MSIRAILFSIAFLLVGSYSFAQRDCGAVEYLEQQMQLDPKRGEKMDRIEKHTQNFLKNPTRDVTGTVTIPVVVHVVYNTSAENISDAQIQTQIDVLNDDFRRLNSDADNTWSQAADSEIEFCLATVDPSGNATTGITRTSTSVTSFGTNDQVKFNSSGGKDAWPAADYLNIWVCDISGGILGYAQFPGGNPATDGVVNDYQYFGTIGTATAPFNLGRTMTHEVGHYLNLRHIWGDGNCNADDFVSDTPTSDAPNYGCALGHVSCSSTDMVQNYMDYSDDACMNLFTQGQKARMRALFDTGGARESLLSSAACGSPADPTCDDGIQNQGETGVDCGGPCPDACPTCDDGIQNQGEEGVDCGGPNCAPCPCTGTDVTVTINLDNYPEETSWTITNAGGAVVASGGTYGSQPDGSTVTITECLADGCYDFTINDTYGDGICCAYGSGSYTVTGGGNTLASGGSFGSSETTNFCLGGGSGPTCDDGIQNGDETGVDCGGSCPDACPTCDDGIQNGDETGVDCGGSCPNACPTCDDGIQNGDETGVDCGGSCPNACPTCDDGIQNQGEEGIDCGGPNCAPCSCIGTDVTITINFDNYPEETSWTITNAGGSVVASGGTYGSQPDGSTLTITECLADGCYDFTINDTYGDGICCAYGSGSYTVTGGGITLASGGTFGSSETTNFCLGGGSGPSCNDGIQNGDETGVDCGGSCPDTCPPTVDCSYTTINFNNFEGGWGIWNDGGSDCRRSANDAAYALGTYCVRLRDNTSTSVMTTDNLNLSAYEELTVDFSYYPRSMDNSNEDFWLQISTDGGASYTTVEEWNQNDEFQNNQRYFDSVIIPGPFTSNTRLRFRCDASGNSDWVYIDEVDISGCLNANREAAPPSEIETTTAISANVEITDVNLFPNPTRGQLTVDLNVNQNTQVQFFVTDMNGKLLSRQVMNIDAGQFRTAIDASRLNTGVYILHIVTEESRMAKKFVVLDK